MSSTETNSENPAVLRAKVAELSKQVEAKSKAARTKQNLVLLLGAGLTVLVIVCLSAVTKLMRSLDAEAVAQIGRIEVQKQLPDGRQAVQDYLKREAPRLVGDALKGLVNMVPRARQLLVNDLSEKLGTINSEFEKRISGQMAQAIHNSKKQVDQAWPDATDAEKLEKLVEAVARDFNTNISAATTEMYPAYAREMAQVIAYLEDLNHKKGADLTAEQAERKEIIETLLQLIARAKQKG